MRELFFKTVVLIAVIYASGLRAQNRIPNRFDIFYKPCGIVRIIDTSVRYGSKVCYNYDDKGCIVAAIYETRNGQTKRRIEYESEVLSDNALRIFNKNDSTILFIYHHMDKLDSVFMCYGQTERFYFEYNYDGNLKKMEQQTLDGCYSCIYDYREDSVVGKEYRDNILRETQIYIYTEKHRLKQIIVESANKSSVIADVMPWDDSKRYMYSISYDSFDSLGNWTKSYFTTRKRKVLRCKRKIEYSNSSF